MNFEAVIQKWGLTTKVGQVGDGWAELVDNTLSELDELGCRSESITKIKENKGLLRIRATFPDDTAPLCAEVIALALIKSRTTCEFCGHEAKLQDTPNGIKAICQNCLTEGKMGQAYLNRQESDRLRALARLTQLQEEGTID